MVLVIIMTGSMVDRSNHHCTSFDTVSVNYCQGYLHTVLPYSYTTLVDIYGCTATVCMYHTFYHHGVVRMYGAKTARDLLAYSDQDKPVKNFAWRSENAPLWKLVANWLFTWYPRLEVEVEDLGRYNLLRYRLSCFGSTVAHYVASSGSSSAKKRKKILYVRCRILL